MSRGLQIWRFALLATTCAVGADSLADAPVTPLSDASQDVAGLVRALGSPSFALREQATAALASIGLPARDELSRALRSPDAEVRRRARQVLAGVLELDFRMRLEAFIQDSDGAAPASLPGWERFRRLVGDGSRSRELFAEMQRAEPSLLETLESAPDRIADVLESRCRQLQRFVYNPATGQRQSIAAGTVAAFLFVGSDDQVAITPQTVSYVTSFVYHSAFRAAVGHPDREDPLRKLLGAWVGRGHSGESPGAFQNLMLSLQFDLPEGLRPALAMVADKNAAPHMRQYAILVVGRFGGPEHRSALTGLLHDESTCAALQVGNEQLQTQIRDVALAVTIHLSGRRPAEFGFPRAEPHSSMLYNPPTLGFPNQQSRDEALKNWERWSSSPGAATRNTSDSPAPAHGA